MKKVDINDGSCNFGKCECPKGTFTSLVTVMIPACVLCHENCDGCVEATFMDCKACKFPLITIKTGTYHADGIEKVSCECPEGWHADPKGNCLITVIDPTSVCTTAGGFTDNTLTCQTCDLTSCAACVKSSTTCTACYLRSSKIILKTNTTDKFGQCGCATDWFENKEGNCEKCDRSCAACNAEGLGPGSCTSCHPLASVTPVAGGYCKCNTGSYLNEKNGRCEEPCATGWTDALSVCEHKCHPACGTCAGDGNDSCLSCATGWINIGQGKSSIFSKCFCMKGKWLDESTAVPMCMDCHYTCSECTGPRMDQCHACGFDRDIKGNCEGKTCECA
jgi:proprotein convertase subtilisin/kexin type 5